TCPAGRGKARPANADKASSIGTEKIVGVGFRCNIRDISQRRGTLVRSIDHWHLVARNQECVRAKSTTTPNPTGLRLPRSPGSIGCEVCSSGGGNEGIVRGIEDAAIEVAEVRASRKVAKVRSEEHTSELQSRFDLVCRLLLEKKNRHSSILTFPNDN